MKFHKIGSITVPDHHREGEVEIFRGSELHLTMIYLRLEELMLLGIVHQMVEMMSSIFFLFLEKRYFTKCRRKNFEFSEFFTALMKSGRVLLLM